MDCNIFLRYSIVIVPGLLHHWPVLCRGLLFAQDCRIIELPSPRIAGIGGTRLLGDLETLRV